MTQALNNLLGQNNLVNNLPTNLSSNNNATNNNMSQTNSTTDFQKLFDKQNTKEAENSDFNRIGENSPYKTNEVICTTNKDKFTEDTSQEKNTLASSVENLYQNFKDLMEFISPEIAGLNVVQTDINDNKDIIMETISIDTPSVDNISTDLTLENIDDFNVTINGKNLDNFFKDFLTNNQEEETTLINTDEVDSKSLDDLVDEETLKELNIESIEVETTSDNESSSEDFMQNQTPEEQGLKAMLNDITNNVPETKSFENTVKTIQETNTSSTTSSEKILAQVEKQMNNLQNNSKVNFIMNPERLGRLSIQLVNTDEGLSAQFTVATQDAKNILMKGLDGLKETLLTHGINVDNINIKLNESQESEQNSDWTEQEGSRGGNKEQNNNRQQNNNENFEQMMSDIETNDNV